ncbi:hypothetical protein [uncultured Phocaeicola sp.]|uniref:hypothetical protein n=1 Tax=uncultured Phocaeicola sp. TaxID=990718 RepID=UPI0025A1354A|nr:hypothetical protein [uncultured Phocaeicola sp.]
MDEEIKNLLDEEIKSQINTISGMDVDDENYSKAVDSLVKLHKLRIEETKSITDSENLAYKRETDEETCKLNEEIRQEQLSEQKKDRYIRIGLDVAGLLVPIMFYSAWMRKGFKFEETGTFTSTTFRGLFGHFKPTRR